MSSKLSTDDLVITNRKTGKAIPTSAMKVQYDASSNRATWTFPGLANHMLQAGDYTVTLRGSGIVDDKNTALDGNYDGVSGGDFSSRLKIKKSHVTV